MLTLTSPSFRHGDLIPRNHTSDGQNRPPALTWAGLPAGTRSLALVVEDPDAPDPAAPLRIFAHWLVYDIPPSVDRLGSGLPPGARLGRNDFGHLGYEGPAPPVGRHRYFFRLFALDATLPPGLGECDRAALMRAIQGHVIEEAELMGVYERERRSARVPEMHV